MKKNYVLCLAVLSSVVFSNIKIANRINFSKAHQNRFVSEYTSKDDYIEAASNLNLQICEEGMVLLKNKDNILPFNSVKKISVFGKNSAHVFRGKYGLSGSNIPSSDLHQSLEDAGYIINPSLKEFYSKYDLSGEGQRLVGWKRNLLNIGETPLSMYSDSLIDSFDEYNDAAIVVISRTPTGLFNDLPTIGSVDDHYSKPEELSKKHALQLSNNEEEMISMVKSKFNKIVILINGGNIFQCDQFENDDKIQGVIYMGVPGGVGISAVGKILNGEINPSGRTVDTWARDFKEDPTYQNFGDNSQTCFDDKKSYPQDTMINSNGKPIDSISEAIWSDESHHVAKEALNNSKPGQYINYEEGVYVDYRYYETKYADLEKDNKGLGDEWYNSSKGVIYPFGYGLSYTNFTQKISSIDVSEGTVLTGKKKKINVTVKVKNVGKKIGKEVIQLYWKAPYVKSGIEKPYEILCAFAKTNLLNPNEEQEVNLSFNLQDVASYDFDDKNNNGFKGYELDGGDYFISLNKNAHESFEERKVVIQKEGIKYKNDRFTGKEVKNRFSNNDIYSSLPLEKDVGFDQMSRLDFEKTFPTHPTLEDRTLKSGSRVEEYLTHEFELADLEVYHNGFIDESAYKAKGDIPKNWSQQKNELPKESRTQLIAMKGISIDDPKWDDFLNQFTYDELKLFVENGTFQSPSLDAIGKPRISETDGPSRLDYIWWASASTIAATYNVELAKKYGEMVGIEAHFNNKNYGWFAPTIEIHRSPFGAENVDNFSSDPLIIGKMASEIVSSATEKGLICFANYLGIHNQDTGRDGISSYVTEQALRELYLKPFQMVVEEGYVGGIMTANSRIGNVETSNNYRLLVDVLRNEWGFKGEVTTDMKHHGNTSFNHKRFENINSHVLSGTGSLIDLSRYNNDIEARWSNDANDGKGAPIFTYIDKETNEEHTKESYSWWYAVRKAAQNRLFVFVNSGGMDGDLIQLLNDEIIIEGEKDGIITIDSKKKVDIKVSYSGKLKNATYQIDNYQALPDGLKFENDSIVGRVEKEGNYLVHIIIKCKDKNGVEKEYAKEFRIFVEGKDGVEGAFDVNDYLGIIIGAPIALVVIGGGVFSYLFLKKRKRKF